MNRKTPLPIMMLSENTKEAPDGYTLLTFGTSYGLLVLNEYIDDLERLEVQKLKKTVRTSILSCIRNQMTDYVLNFSKKVVEDLNTPFTTWMQNIEEGDWQTQENTTENTATPQDDKIPGNEYDMCCAG